MIALLDAIDAADEDLEQWLGWNIAANYRSSSALKIWAAIRRATAIGVLRNMVGEVRPVPPLHRNPWHCYSGSDRRFG